MVRRDVQILNDFSYYTQLFEFFENGTLKIPHYLNVILPIILPKVFANR